jgi:hypothetical protein
MNIKQLKTQPNALLTRSQQQHVKGGLAADPLSECSIPCNGKTETRNCGRGVSCTTNATQIICGSDPVFTCDPKKPG